jgi:hypothetical protein
MNKEDAHLYLPFVQALADGKTLQAKNIQGKWIDLSEIEFGGEPEHYRIKPEPRKWKVWLDSHGYIQGTVAEILKNAPTGWTQIEVAETLPENEQ